jgi:hypothetical protein
MWFIVAADCCESDAVTGNKGEDARRGQQLQCDSKQSPLLTNYPEAPHALNEADILSNRNWMHSSGFQRQTMNGCATKELRKFLAPQLRHACKQF